MKRIDEKLHGIILEQFTDKSLNILELCPGKGNLTRALLDSGYGNIEALDINPEKFQIPEVNCHRGNLNDPLPFAEESYDLVIIEEGIEHLEYQYRFAAECNRILKTGGSLILTTPNIMNFASRIKFLLTGFYALAGRPSSEFEKNWVIEHIYPLTFWQLRHILHTNGLFISMVATDHIRRSALIGLLVWPLSYFFTWRALATETEPRQLAANREITRQIHSMSLFLGRTQIVLATKKPHDYVKAV